jgi:hypothetical protein
MERMTSGRCDGLLTDALVADSATAVRWLRDLGMPFRLMYERQAYERADGSYLFWGGLAVGAEGGGKGLMAGHREIADRLSTDVRYERCCSTSSVTARASPACSGNDLTALAVSSRRRPWCSRRAASRLIPSCDARISARAGSTPGCAARR